jgi:hypothetical protein
VRAGVEADAIGRAADGARWRTLAALATEVGADVLVGSRGRSDVGSLVRGSTSHGLVYDCLVLLVWSPGRVKGETGWEYGSPMPGDPQPSQL